MATKLWAAAQWLLNAALTGNPIGIAVVAVTAQTELMQRELDLVWEHLLPALESGGGTAQADEALERELAALRLEPPPRLVRRPESVVGLLDVDHRVVESAPLLGRVESVRISRRDGGFVMTWRADGADHETPVGVGAWLRGQLPSPWSFPPAVAVAGEAGADGIRVRVVFQWDAVGGHRQEVVAMPAGLHEHEQPVERE